MRDFIDKMDHGQGEDLGCHEEFETPSKIWNAAAQTPEPKNPNLNRVWSQIEPSLVDQPRRKPWLNLWTTRLALSTVAIACIVLVLAKMFLPAEREIRTGPGQTQKFTLPDGSEVVLNAVSKIRFDRFFGRDNRQLELEGEAFFDVVHGDMPFAISVAKVRVQVVGTRFNVRSRETGVEVGVTDGRVEVRAHISGKETRVVLSKGERVFWPHGDLPQTVQNLKYTAYPPWTAGVLAFDSQRFSSVCRELERRFDIRFVIENPDVGNKLVSGNLDGNGNLQNVLEVLGRLGGCSITQEKGVYVIR